MSHHPSVAIIAAASVTALSGAVSWLFDPAYLPQTEAGTAMSLALMVVSFVYPFRIGQFVLMSIAGVLTIYCGVMAGAAREPFIALGFLLAFLLSCYGAWTLGRHGRNA